MREDTGCTHLPGVFAYLKSSPTERTGKISSLVKSGTGCSNIKLKLFCELEEVYILSLPKNDYKVMASPEFSCSSRRKFAL